MYGLDYPAGKGESCARCRRPFTVGETKYFADFIERLFVQGYAVPMGVEVCHPCLYFVNRLGFREKSDIATGYGLKFLLNDRPVRLTLITRVDGQYQIQHGVTT